MDTAQLERLLQANFEKEVDVTFVDGSVERIFLDWSDNGKLRGWLARLSDSPNGSPLMAFPLENVASVKLVPPDE